MPRCLPQPASPASFSVRQAKAFTGRENGSTWSQSLSAAQSFWPRSLLFVRIRVSNSVPESLQEAPSPLAIFSFSRGCRRRAWFLGSRPPNGDETKLDPLGQIVAARPVFNDLSVGDAVNVNLLGLERLAGRLKTDELSRVSATRDDSDDHFVACIDLILNVVVKITKCIPQPSNRDLQTFWPRRCPWAGLVVDEIRMKDLVHDGEISACEDLV